MKEIILFVTKCAFAGLMVAGLFIAGMHYGGYIQMDMVTSKCHGNSGFIDGRSGLLYLCIQVDSYQIHEKPQPLVPKEGTPKPKGADDLSVSV